MGIHQEKYTKTYFIGKNDDGTPAGYGVEGGEAFKTGDLRDIDKSILSRVDFVDRHVIEFGFGRGEAIKYVLENGARIYEGVDFAPAALEIAKEFLKEHNVSEPQLYCCDALQFVESLSDDSVYDIVIMLDFIEHVPRIEFKRLLMKLRDHLSENAVLIINTPVYREDNDVLQDGLKTRNQMNMIDISNSIPETSGMHCNLYTIPSLQQFMKDCGYTNVTEAHFFTKIEFTEDVEIKKSYRQSWENAVRRGLPLVGTYVDDVLEYAFVVSDVPRLSMFDNGDLQGLKFLMTESYLNLFSNGCHDRDLIVHAKQYTKKDAVIFDVGGFMGMSSLLLRKHLDSHTKIFCFEPNGWNLNRILYNLSHNPKYAGEIFCVNLALSERNETIEMLCSDNIDEGHSSTSQLTIGDGTDNSHETLFDLGFHMQTVNALSLDYFVQKTGIVPDVIKVDIEGAEALFLQGAKNVLEDYRPILYIELHTIMATMRCIRYLCESNYNIHILSHEGDGRIIVACLPSTHEKVLTDLWMRYEYEGLRIDKRISDKNVSDLYSKLLNKHAEVVVQQSENNELARRLTSEKEETSELERQLTISHEQLTIQQSDFSDLETQLNSQLHRNEELSKELNAQQSQIEELVKELTTQQTLNDELKIQLDTVNVQFVAQQTHITEIMKSTSWRITKPARHFKKIFIHKK